MVGIHGGEGAEGGLHSLQMLITRFITSLRPKHCNVAEKKDKLGKFILSLIRYVGDLKGLIRFFDSRQG